MSQENVEIVRRAYDAWNAADRGAFRELYARDAMIVLVLEGWPEPGPLVGRDAIMWACRSKDTDADSS